MNRGTDSDNAKAIQVNETQCRLGKWLTKEETLEVFGQVPSFRGVSEPHRQVHQNMHHALELMSRNWATDYSIQEEMFVSFQKVEAGSDGVIAALDSMVSEKHEKR